MTRLDRIEIANLSNVAPGTTLSFGPKGAVLLGKNGTGKTTLLNTVVAMCRCDFDSVSKNDFDVSFTLVSNKNIQVSVTMRLSSDKESKEGTIEQSILASEFAAFRKSRYLKISFKIDDSIKISIESSDTNTTVLISGEAKTLPPLSPQLGWLHVLACAFANKEVKSQLTELYFELQGIGSTLRRFDEALDYLKELTEESLNDQGFVINAEQSENESFPIPTGLQLISRSLASKLLRDFEPDGKYDFLLFLSEDSKHLSTFCELTGFDEITAIIDLDKTDEVGKRKIFKFKRLNFSLDRAGKHFRHTHLSFGQKRLLAFLYYLESTGTIVVADEFVNGMHYQWIERCNELLRDRQTFQTSQNPLLFDFMHFESAEDVAEQIVECSLNEHQQFIWRNMSCPEATEFFDLYQVGIQHVSEILRTRGYW